MTKQLVDQTASAAAQPIKQGKKNTVKITKGQHLRLQEQLQGQAEEIGNVIATKQGANLQLKYADGTEIIVENFFVECIGDVCSFTLPGEDAAGYAIGADAPLGETTAEGAQLVYAYGEQSSLMELAGGDEAISNVLADSGEGLLSYTPTEEGVSGWSMLSALLPPTVAGLSASGGGGAAAVVANVMTGTVMAGPVVANSGLVVEVYAADGTTKLGEAEVEDDGSFIAEVGSYSGVVIARVKDGNGDLPDYVDEATGEEKALVGELMMVGVLSGSNMAANINPLTTVSAVVAGIDATTGVPAESLDVAAVDNANAVVASIFGLDDLLGETVTPTVTVDGDVDTAYSSYGAALASLSGMDQTGDMQATIKALAAAVDVNAGTLSEEMQDQVTAGAAAVMANKPGLVAMMDTILAKKSSSVSINSKVTGDGVVSEAETMAGVTLSGTNAEGATVELTAGSVNYTAVVDGTTWSYTFSPDQIAAMGQGAETITATATLEGGAQASASRLIRVDTLAEAPSLALSQDTGNSDSDAITNDASINVTLANDVASWEYSLDGGSTWSAGSGTSFELADDSVYAIGEVQVRQTDTAGNTSSAASNAAAITTDMSVAAPSLALAMDSGASSSDNRTSDATVSVTLAEDVASWEYSLDGGTNWNTGSGTSFELANDSAYAIGEVQVRQTDTAGNTSSAASNTAAITTDMSVAVPSFALATDSGSSSSDNLSNDATINVTLADDVASWEYSLDGGSTWSAGSGTSFELADDSVYAIGEVQVRQTDTAGNTSSAASNTAAITTDMSVAAPSFAMATDSGSSSSDNLTSDATINVTLTDDVASWEYSLDGGTNWNTGSGTSFELANDSAYAIGEVQVRQTDTAGNLSSATSNTAAITTDMSVAAPSLALATDSGASSSDSRTSDATINVTLADDLASWEYSLDAGTNWSDGSGSSFELANDSAYAIGAVQVRQTDTAGNTSSAASNTAAITTDMSVAAPSLALATDSGSSSSDNLTSDASINVTLADDVASWEYSLDGGSTWSAGSGTSFELADDSVYAIGEVQVRQTDTAGNTSSAASNTAAITTDMSVAAPSLALVMDSGASSSDNRTSDATINVTLADDVASWEYSLDGGTNWNTGSGTSFELANDTVYAIGEVQVRQTDTAGNTSSAASNTAAITTDMSVAAPSLALATDSGSSSSDNLSNDATINVTLADDVASWEYSLDGGTNWSTGSGSSFELANDTVYAIGEVQVRQTDTAGNTSSAASNTAAITTDMSVAAPSFAMATDSGSSSSDNLTSDATINVTLTDDVASWEYSLDGGTNWNTGSGTSFELANDSAYAIGEVQVRQTDTAGNLSSATSNTAAITTDMSAAAPSFALATDSGSSSSDSRTSDATINVTLADDLASWEYSLDGGSTWSAGSGTSFELAADTVYAIGAVQVRQTDTAGNTSSAASNTAAITTDMSVAAPSLALATDSGASASDMLTNDATVNITGLEALASFEYSTDGGSIWQDGSGASVQLTGDGEKTILVRQTDVAGNISANSAALDFTLDTSLPTGGIDTVATDGTVNSSEKAAGVTITGSSDAEDGQAVSVVWGETSKSATVSEGSWSVTFDAAEIPADGSTTLSADVSDLAGNAAIQMTQAVTVDSSAPSVTAIYSVDENTLSDTDPKSITLEAVEAVTWSGLTGTDAGSFTLNDGQLTFAGVTDKETKDSYSLSVTATDTAGNATTQAITVNIDNVNEAPVVVNAIADQTFVVGGVTDSFSFAADVFSDVDDGDTLAYTAALVGGGDLPSWLSFDAGSRTFSGNPTEDATIAVQVTATDGGALTDSSSFNLISVSAPVISTTLADVTNLDVRSNIVLSVDQEVLANNGGVITLTDLGGTGFQGDSTTNTQTIAVTDSTQVTIENNGANSKIVINPQFDLDLSSNYSLAISTAAFSGITSEQGTVAFSTLSFSTVEPGVGIANAVQAQTMDDAGVLADSLEWFDATDTGSLIESADILDFSTSNYAAVVKASVLTEQDTVFEGDGHMSLIDFGVDDLFYVDNQDNSNSVAQASLNGNAFAGGDGSAEDPLFIGVGGTGSLGAYQVNFQLDDTAQAALPADVASNQLLENVLSTSWSNTGMVIAG